MTGKTRARALRRDSTEAERLLWQRLRNRQTAGLKFRRQEPLGPYVVDFLCLERRLIVELDGGQHAREALADAARTAWLRARAYRVIRFWNHEVIDNIEGVLEAIVRAAGATNCPSPCPSPSGRGDAAARSGERPFMPGVGRRGNRGASRGPG